MTISKKPEPKGQHFIPCLHLRHFIGLEEQVWSYDKNSGRQWSAIPDETAKQTHFYSIEKDDGTYDTRLEQFLCECETKAAPVYRDLLAGKLPANGSKEKHTFSSFLGLMYVRTPAMRRDAAALFGRLMQVRFYAYGINERAFNTLTRKIEKDLGSISAEQKAKLRQTLIDPSDFKMQVPKERTFIAFEAGFKLASLLFEMNWAIADARHGYFITSDNPLVRSVDPRTRHPIYGDHGFLNKTVEVSFPLSSRRLLFMTWKSTDMARGLLDRSAVDRLNQMRAYYADEFLYSHLGDKRLSRLATTMKGSRPRMTTQGFGPKTFAEVEVPRRWSARGRAGIPVADA